MGQLRAVRRCGRPSRPMRISSDGIWRRWSQTSDQTDHLAFFHLLK